MPEYTRSRSKGSTYSSGSIGVIYRSRYARMDPPSVITTKVDGYGEYSGGTTYDDREWLDDCTGTDRRFNPAMHRRYYPFVLQPPALCSLADTPPTNPAWYGYYGVWKPYGDVLAPLGNATHCCFQDLFDKPVGILTGYERSPDWSSLVDQAGSQLDGRLTSSQNLLVSLAEIGQTVGMVKNPFGVRKLVRALRGAPLRKAYRLGPSAYLEWKFGWENLIRDINAIANVWQEVRQHKDFLERSVNTYISHSARSKESELLNWLGNHAVGPNIGYLSILPYIVERRWTWSFSFDLLVTEAMNAWSTWDQVLSRLGTREIAEALWDLVPFSFVVDWFTHVNRIISRGPIQWNSYDVRRMGWSIKAEAYGELRCSSVCGSYGQDPIPVTSIQGPYIVEKYYERCPGFPPDTASVGLFGHLNKTQIAEGLSLIVQRI